MRRPARGFSRSNRSRIWRSTGIVPLGPLDAALPLSASARSLTRLEVGTGGSSVLLYVLDGLQPFWVPRRGRSAPRRRTRAPRSQRRARCTPPDRSVRRPRLRDRRAAQPSASMMPRGGSRRPPGRRPRSALGNPGRCRRYPPGSRPARARRWRRRAGSRSGRASPAATTFFAAQRAAYAPDRSTFDGSFPLNAPPPCRAMPPYVSTMILRPVRPASPCGPPMTNRPVGLMWKRVSRGRTAAPA